MIEFSLKEFTEERFSPWYSLISVPGKDVTSVVLVPGIDVIPVVAEPHEEMKINDNNMITVTEAWKKFLLFISSLFKLKFKIMECSDLRI